MWISQPDGTVEFCNREWRDYTGLDWGSGSRAWREAIHPDDRPHLEKIRKQAVARGEPYDVQIRLRRHDDGAFLWHMGRIAPVHLHGKLIAWIGAATDIDARLQAEASLRESEANFRILANAIPQLAWMWEPGGKAQWYNRRWFDFTGMSVEQVQGDGWWQAIHPAHLGPMMEVVRAARSRGEAWEYVAPLRRLDDTYRWFLFRSVPLRDEGSGTVARWFGTGTDINDQQEAQERQRLLTQEVSHRVKNSLALVAGQLLLQAQAPGSEDAGKVLMDAYSRVLTIAGVHDHLWRQYGSRFTEIGGFLGDLCRKLQETAPGHEIVFSGNRLVVPTDRAVPIGLVVNELVTNALKYAYPGQGGGPIRVNLRESGDGRTLVLEVIDRGAGMPDGFDLSAPHGSLGMTLLVNTIQQIGGTATVAGADPGTRFEIRIPDDRDP